jgi:pimeloyl-ACP methyl ester carboxylesterase
MAPTYTPHTAERSGDAAPAVDAFSTRPNEITMVPTRLGRLKVEMCGSGPPAVLWHSLFVDSTTWERVREPLSAVRRLILIDGPSHGGSPGPGRIFTLDECAGAAADVLTHLGVDGPVDWVGNAWGGHVGLLFATASPDRVRSLVTIGTPVQALSSAERPKITALVTLYRLTGPIRPLVKTVTNALLGRSSAAANPENARLVGDALRRTKRRGLYLAMRSVMLNRADSTDALTSLTIPTMFVKGADDPVWTVEQIQSSASLVPGVVCELVPGGGHVAPLLDGASDLVELTTAFWAESMRKATQPAAV